MNKRYWEDLAEEELLICNPVILSQEEIIHFGRKYDPQPFHVHEAAASASRFGGIIASSLQTLSACTRVLVDAQGELAILSGLAIDKVLLPNPVRPNDCLRIEAAWYGLRRSQSKPDRGIGTLRFKAVNQKGEMVLESGYQYLIACRDYFGTEHQRA